MQRKTLQQPDIIKTNTSVYLCLSKNTKRDLIDNNQPDFLKFTSPYSLLLFLSHTQQSFLEASFFPTPLLNFPQQIMSVLNLTFLCFSFALFLLFYPLSSECISSSPLLQFCLYPVSQICITKVYHIRLAYGKGGILFWKVKGIREKKNPSGQK